MPGLGASFGRGAATNYQQDMANSDCILFMGSNMAEAQPVGFRWSMEAKEKGATLIHVDPRFTRMSAVCDVYVGIRSGSDIAFLGGLVNYVLSNERWFHEYVLAYTNASTIIDEGFRDTEDLAGLFSGFDSQDDAYDAQQGHWGYEGPGECGQAPEGGSKHSSQAKYTKGRHGLHGHGMDGNAEASPSEDMGAERADPTLQHPRCVMQILRRHFARYTPEVVSEVCGCTAEEFTRVADLLCQQLRTRANHLHRLCAGMDAAHDRRADNTYCRHLATVARQRGSAGRRHHGPARPLYHPGCDRRLHPV